jgi:signal transduction histidine kinase
MTTTGLRVLPSPTERTIVVFRVVLAVSSLFAVWLDRTEPARYVVPTYTLHSLYVVYAIGLAFFAWNRAAPGHWPLATHLGDIAVCAVFQILSLGPSSSPFFTYFVFSLFCGALRWGWQGTLRTAALVLTLFVVMGVSMRSTIGPEAFDLARYVIRAFYLAVVAGLLMVLGRHEARLRRNMVRLARWPAATRFEGDEGLARVVGHAAQIVGAGRATVAWEAGDEPWLHLAAWSPAGITITRHGPSEFSPLVPADLADAIVLCTTSGAEQRCVFLDRGGELVPWQGPAFHPGLARRLDGIGLISAPIRLERVEGRVFFTDLTAPTAELMTMTGVVAREIGGSIEQLSLAEQLREVAASDQRLRVARDLHDGVLQSLTGIRFELQDVAAQLTGEATMKARQRLLGVERSLAIEQRELRMFINSLKPREETSTDNALLHTLDALRERVASEWKVPVTIRVGPRVAAMPSAIERAVPPMVHEAVVNALKHGAPSRIRVDVDVEQDALRIVVADDGHGFPFRGRYDHHELVQARLGPASLRDRAASFGGTLAIDSQSSGSRVEIVLPLASGVGQAVADLGQTVR